jgi:competence protein ComEC
MRGASWRRPAGRVDPAFAWRFAALAGIAAGLALSQLAPGVDRGECGLAIAVALAAAAGLALARPRRGSGALTWLGLVALGGGMGGAAVGALRLASIDGGAFDQPAGRQLSIRGYVAATPSRSNGTVRIRLDTAEGALLVEAREPVGDLPIGRELAARGVLRRAPPWEAGWLARYGIREVLAATRVRLTGGRRGGLSSAVDSIRDRAAAALGRGTSSRAAALLRGFVLGEADRIDPATVTDFRRSGLAHLLAVSGENVLLLALLAAPLLGLAGLPLRLRLWLLLALIALYVAVTGAGPSIQRAGVMGAAGVVAALAGRPRSRWYAMLLAAAITLAANPRATGDPGWQLSFAAVIGIMVLARPVRETLLLAAPGRAGRLRTALAEGAAVTIAATIATAPLIGADFGVASLTTLPANLLALPAVAPVMWLGMIVAALGQLPWLPVEPLTALGGALAGYVAQVADWLGSPSWAQVGVPSLSPPAVVAVYVGLAVIAGGGLSFALRRRGTRLRRGAVGPALAVAALAALLTLAPETPAPGSRGAPGLRVSVLDVGQGDAILLDPSPGLPILVDGGPPGDGIASILDALGVDRLAAAVVTHDQLDHAGGIEDLLGTLPIAHLIYGEPVPRLLREARVAGARPVEMAAGSEVDSGPLRLGFLWPPRELESRQQAREEDPNVHALVGVARWRSFSILLTADAEAGDVPIDPGPIDVLKVAHHGSEDSGLDRLLDEAAPRLAVISVGADNPYGHPTAATLRTLAAHHVPILRTDLDGTVEIDADPDGWSVRALGG